MAFNASDFRNAFPKSGNRHPIASPAYFEAEFDSIPACMLSISDNTKKQKIDAAFRGIKFRCQATDLPSRQIMAMGREFNAPKKMMPYSSLYQSLIVDFLETDGFDIRTFFDIWQDEIEGANRGYKTEYYDNLVVPKFTMTAYSKNGVPLTRWIFKNVFPIAINVSQMNWSQQHQALNIPVELNFQKWEFEIINSAAAVGSTQATNGGTNQNNKNSFMDSRSETEIWHEFGSKVFGAIFNL